MCIRVLISAVFIVSDVDFSAIEYALVKHSNSVRRIFFSVKTGNSESL